MTPLEKKLRNGNHRLPQTRRQFLSHGAIAFSGAVLLPTWWDLLFAHAAEAKETSIAVDLPYLVIDCAGGAAFPGNFLVTGKDQRPLGSYSVLGFDGRNEVNLDRSFGLPMAAKESGILRGMRAAASKEALAHFRMGSFCHFALDDQDTNTLSTIAMAYRVSKKGQHLNTIVSMNATASGGRSRAVLADTMPKPTPIAKIEDLVSSVGFGVGTSLSALPKGLLGKYGKALSAINTKFAERQLKKISDRDAVTKSYEAIEKSIRLSPSVDPRGDTEIARIYGLNAGTRSGEFAAVSATIVKSVLEGVTGPGVITLGDCDYHDRAPGIAEGIDQTIGTTLGRAVEAAHRLKRPLFIQLITDGGVGTKANTRNWSGDDGTKCMSVIGYYQPKGPAEFATKDRYQIGQFTEGQGADTKTLIGDASGASGANLAYATIANYLAIAEKLGEFGPLFGERFTPQELKSLVLFGG